MKSLEERINELKNKLGYLPHHGKIESPNKFKNGEPVFKVDFDLPDFIDIYASRFTEDNDQVPSSVSVSVDDILLIVYELLNRGALKLEASIT